MSRENIMVRQQGLPIRGPEVTAQIIGSKKDCRSVDPNLCQRASCVSGRSTILEEKDQCGQVTKGMWGMSRRQEAMKGVEDCDKPGGLVKRELIPGYPNDPALNS